MDACEREDEEVSRSVACTGESQPSQLGETAILEHGRVRNTSYIYAGGGSASNVEDRMGDKA